MFVSNCAKQILVGIHHPSMVSPFNEDVWPLSLPNMTWHFVSFPELVVTKKNAGGMLMSRAGPEHTMGKRQALVDPTTVVWEA